MDLTQQARDIRKAFGQFSSSKTQVCNTLKPVELEFDAQVYERPDCNLKS